MRVAERRTTRRTTAVRRETARGGSRKAKSGIDIKPADKGRFTAKARAHGESVQQYANDVLRPGSKASASTKRQADFARNAARWDHKGGSRRKGR